MFENFSFKHLKNFSCIFICINSCVCKLKSVYAVNIPGSCMNLFSTFWKSCQILAINITSCLGDNLIL